MADRNSNYGSRGRDERLGKWGERNAGDDRDEDSNESGSLFRSQEDDQPMYGQYREADQSRWRDRDRDYNTSQDSYSRGRNQGRSDYGQGGRGQQGPNYGRESGSSGTSQYGRSDYGRGGGSNYGWSGSFDEGRGSRYGGWREPFGEGQQYSGGSGYGYDTGRQDQGPGMGPHRGKGPKGYQRSDERLKEMICERLREDPAIDASEVTVNVSGGKVTFDGSVDSRRTKNAVEDIAEQLDALEVQNNLRVSRGGMGAAGGTALSGGTTTQTPTPSESGYSESSKQKRN